MVESEANPRVYERRRLSNSLSGCICYHVWDKNMMATGEIQHYVWKN